MNSKKVINIIQYFAAIGLLLYPFLYGFIILSNGQTPSVPDKYYLYTMKPLQLIVFLVIYLFIIIRIGNRLKARFPKINFLILPIISISLIPIIIFSYTDIYKYLGIIGSDGNVTQDPISCFYFSIVTWTTLGYGDFSPSPEARLFAASEAILGYLFMGIFIGIMLQSLYELRQKSHNN